MLPAQTVSIFLNNALKPTNVVAELDGEAPLPVELRNMPDQVAGRFLELDTAVTHDITSAWKRVMMLNATQVLYTFSFEESSQRFSARKR